MDIKELNAAPDSINLHDATLLEYCIYEQSIKFRFVLGGFHCDINDMGGLFLNKNNVLILDLDFFNISDLTQQIPESFDMSDLEVANHFVADGKYCIEISDFNCEVCKIEFAYKSFEWRVVGEFTNEEYIKKTESHELLI